MLAIAADWRPGSVVRSVEEVLAEPKLAHYVLGWPRAGDFGVDASDDDGRLVGAAWCRSFTADDPGFGFVRSEENTSELQSLMRISYAVFCLENTKNIITTTT